MAGQRQVNGGSMAGQREVNGRSMVGQWRVNGGVQWQEGPRSSPLTLLRSSPLALLPPAMGVSASAPAALPLVLVFVVVTES